jgi:predicted GNAT family N-acyltransferase
VSVRVAFAESEPERARARAIRHAVFVEEQAVPLEVEMDGLDGGCQHFLAWLGSEAVATARARMTPKGWKLERVAVLREHRGRDVGRALVAGALERAPKGVPVIVHAQEAALGFWERAGFVASGPRFEEGGIGHRSMSRAPER